jgi:hypothetical protein
VPVPPDPILRAALRWLEQLPASDIPRTRALFTSHSAFSDIRPTQYDAALTWLQDHGLLDQPYTKKSSELAVLEAAVTQTLWFTDADSLVTGPSDLPEDALRAGEAIGVVAADTYAVVRHAWGKVDTAERSRIGAAGELALMDLLSAIPGVEVRHVATESDGYGYDIEVTASTSNIHLEVKATTRRGRLKIYLSRNEFETMRRDDEWILVTARLDHDLQLAALATVSREWLAASLPVDQQPSARWESVKLEVPPEAIADGIPDLAERLESQQLPPILWGKPLWPGKISTSPGQYDLPPDQP